MGNREEQTLLTKPQSLGLAGLWFTIVIALFAFDPLLEIEKKVGESYSVKIRESLGYQSELDPRIKIFNMDDSTYAQLEGTHLTSTQWVNALSNIIAAKPASITTNHMFGEKEFTNLEFSQLSQVVNEARQNQIKVFATIFTYPTRINGRTAIPHEQLTFRLAEDRVQDFIDRRGHNIYGASPGLIESFSGIGHSATATYGRFPAVVQMNVSSGVPHIGLLAAGVNSSNNGLEIQNHKVPVMEGLLALNFIQPKKLHKISKSLRAITLPGINVTSYVKPGDHVYLFTNMYTGGTIFTESPFGSTPQNYLTAMIASSALQNNWVRHIPFNFYLAMLGLLGLVLGMYLKSGRIWIPVSLVPVTGVAAQASFLFANLYIPWATAIPMFVLGFSLPLFIRQRNKANANRRETERNKREAAKLSAIVHTTQMFAHDVRKPFSILKTAVTAIESRQAPERLKSMLNGMIPEMQSVLTNVEGMISDLLEISAEKELQQDTHRIEDLVALSMKQIFGFQSHYDIQLQYRFQHTLPGWVDSQKLSRVLINIIDNAVQAMGNSGTITVSTRDIMNLDKPFIELSVRNSGTYIVPARINKLFEAFYTHGKKDGTGLGLAIAKKVIKNHGGEIWCESHPDLGTDFCMTIPSAYETPHPASHDYGLPHHSNGYRSPFVQKQANDLIEPGILPNQNTVHSNEYLAVVDDSDFTLEAWKMLTTDIAVVTWSKPEDFLADMKEGQQPPVAIVTDFYFKNGSSYSGFEFANQVKKLCDVPVILSTDQQDPGHHPDILFSIDKEPMQWQALSSLIRKVS